MAVSIATAEGWKSRLALLLGAEFALDDYQVSIARLRPKPARIGIWPEAKLPGLDILPDTGETNVSAGG